MKHIVLTHKMLDEKNVSTFHNRTKISKYIYGFKVLIKPSTVKKFIYLYNKKYIYPHFTIPVTTKCTLKCKDCANLMPYYTNMTNPDETQEALTEQINQLLSMVDYIYEIDLIGGEPLLHKNLTDFVEIFHNSGKVGMIKIITNGTILAQDDLLEQIKGKNVHILISNYGELSRQKKPLIHKLSDFKIPYITSELARTWLDLGGFDKEERSEEELTLQYSKCNTLCRSYFRGKIHLCPRLSHGMDLGLISKHDSDYIDLTAPNMTKEIFYKNYIDLEKKGWYKGCQYCKRGLVDCKVIPSAIQVENIK